jgi:phage/plasmid-like protein (TIGR03299 family)
MSYVSFNDRVLDLLNVSGLNWEVSKERLISFEDEAPTPMYGTFKKTSREFLGAVRDRYSVYQNWQLAESLMFAADSLNLTYQDGGQLHGGRKVFLQASLPEVYIGKSEVKRNLTAINSHDGSTCIGFGSSNTVVVCENTFFRAYKDLTKFRHSVQAPDRVKALAMDMNAAINADKVLISNFKQMADTPLRDEMIERVIKKVFNVSGEQKQDEISTRKKNMVQSFADALDTEIQLEGSTVWGLFNAVTRYTNHIASNGYDKEQKQTYLMSGGGYHLSNLTYELLMREIGEAVEV